MYQLGFTPTSYEMIGIHIGQKIYIWEKLGAGGDRYAFQMRENLFKHFQTCRLGIKRVGTMI
jgi:hypothetical protein